MARPGKRPRRRKPDKKRSSPTQRHSQALFVDVPPPVGWRIGNALIQVIQEEKPVTNALQALERKIGRQRQDVQQYSRFQAHPATIRRLRGQLAGTENALLELKRISPELQTRDGMMHALHQTIPAWVAVERAVAEESGANCFDLKWRIGLVLADGLNPSPAQISQSAGHCMEMAERYSLVKTAIDDMHIRISQKDRQFVERQLAYWANAHQKVLTIPRLPLQERIRLRNYYLRQEQQGQG